MAFRHARPHPPAPIGIRRAWLDLAPLLTGAVSLAGAIGAVLHFQLEGARFVLFLTLGSVTFAALTILWGRAMTRRWLAFGAALGFAPASRRALLDAGTDRPALHGCAGRHPARIRLVHARGHPKAWLEADTELLCAPEHVHALDARARALAPALAPGARVRTTQGRLSLRAPFDPLGAPALLASLGALADALERSD